MGTWLVPFAVLLASIWGLSGIYWEHSLGLFALVVIGATACDILALFVIRRGWRTDTAELAYLGLFLHGVSLFPLVHGLLLPGVLVGPNALTNAVFFWSAGIATLFALPLVIPALGRRIHHWRQWVVGWLGVSFGAAAALLILQPDIGAPAPGSPVAISATIGFTAATLVLSFRQLRLAAIARSLAPLAVSAAFGLLAVAIAAPLVLTEWSLAFWLAHIFDVVGVGGSAIAALVVFRRNPLSHKLLGPVLTVEPIAALEIGLEPVVLAFLDEVDVKDESTHGHLTRTSALAVLVAEELGFDAMTQRRIGLAALLHDVGKITIPHEVLNKPRKLNEEEFAIMRSHASAGAEMVMNSSQLAELAPGIRHHHEQMDGRGYPDGLSGEDIPIDARVVSACDAYDAMFMDRVYRAGMSADKVRAIMLEHAGAQWDPKVVDAVLRVVERRDGGLVRPVDPSAASPLAKAKTHHCVDCLPSDLGVPGLVSVGRSAE